MLIFTPVKKLTKDFLQRELQMNYLELYRFVKDTLP